MDIKTEKCKLLKIGTGYLTVTDEAAYFSKDKDWLNHSDVTISHRDIFNSFGHQQEELQDILKKVLNIIKLWFNNKELLEKS